MMSPRVYIKEWRKHRGLTQKQLADQLALIAADHKLSHVTISNIERGQQSPTLDQLYIIADALSVPIVALIEVDPT